MTDPASQGSASGLTIPEDLKQKYPDLIELIIQSQSMNTEERQYWINILPIMTPEQVQNLRDILTNEKKQLQEIDKKYSTQLDAAGEKEKAIRTEGEIKEKRAARQQKEEEFEREEEQQTEALLNKIESL